MRSAVPENGCLIFCGGRKKNRKKTEKKQKKYVKHIRIRLIGGCVNQSFFFQTDDFKSFWGSSGVYLADQKAVTDLHFISACCRDQLRSLFDDDAGTARASVSSSGHVTADDVTVDMCTAACSSARLYFPFDRWHCSVDLSAATEHLQLTANHVTHLNR